MTPDTETQAPGPMPEPGTMLETIGVVVATEGALAWLDLEPPASCASCAGGACCGTRLFGPRGAPQRIAIDRPAGTQPGDRLVIGLTAGTVVQAAALAYGVPLLSLLAGALCAGLLGAGDGGTVLAAGAGLALGVIGCRRWARPLQDSGRLQPVVLGRAPETADLGAPACGIPDTPRGGFATQPNRATVPAMRRLDQ